MAAEQSSQAMIMMARHMHVTMSKGFYHALDFRSNEELQLQAMSVYADTCARTMLIMEHASSTVCWNLICQSG